MLLAVLAAIVASAATVMPANAANHIKMQASVNSDGNGHLLANYGEAPWFWEACAPDLTSCVPFGKGREVGTMGASPGTVFRVESHGATGVSPEWRGRVKQMKPPSVSGFIRANEFVSPLPGRWAGGWKGEFSQMQLSACTAPEGQGCTTLTDLHYIRNCPSSSSSFALEARFTGYYLRVAEKRVGTGPPLEPAYGITSPNAGEVWGRSRITSVAILGQIAPAANPYSGECGPPPPGRASISRQGIAQIECPGGCRAALVGSRNGRQVRVKRSLPEHSVLIVPPPTDLRLPPRALTETGRGSIRLIVAIDGKRVAQRTIRSSAGR